MRIRKRKTRLVFEKELHRATTLLFRHVIYSHEMLKSERKSINDTLLVRYDLQ